MLTQKVEDQISLVRQQLTEIQQLRGKYVDAELFEKKKEIKGKMEKWVRVEESILRQKSRVQWRRLGDSNSA